MCCCWLLNKLGSIVCRCIFFLGKNPGVLPYTNCTEPLPSFKIAAINQEDFKGYKRAISRTTFSTPGQRYSHQSAAFIAFFFSSICPSHFDSSTICPLAHSHWPTFLSVRDNAAHTAQSISRWWGRSTLKDPEQEVLTSDKRYLNLRGGSLVPDSPDNRGLSLLDTWHYTIKKKKNQKNSQWRPVMAFFMWQRADRCQAFAWYERAERKRER